MIRTVTEAKLRAYRCWKQKILSGTKGATTPDLLKHFIALNADNIQAVYLVFYNRMHFFSRHMLEDCLYRSKTAGRLRAMRKSLYLIPKEYFAMLFSATHQQREHAIRQAQETWDIDDKEFTETSRVLLQLLAGGEKKRIHFKNKMPREQRRTIETKIGKNIVTSSTIDLIIDWLMERWQIIPGAETWNKTGRKYCLFDSIHAQEKFPMNQEKAEQELVLKYIDSYGPVHIEDIAWWCELTIKRATEIVGNHEDSLSTLKAAETDEHYYIVKEESKHVLSCNEVTSDICCFLSQNDPFFSGYRLNELTVRQEYEKDIFPEFGQVAPVVLIDGMAAGTWNYNETPYKIKLSIKLLKKINPKIEDKLCLEIDHLGDFLGGEDKTTEVNLEYSQPGIS
ncbi:DNA glycosylase AlkZ-like family protein [candidate division KSB1 bacterium]